MKFLPQSILRVSLAMSCLILISGCAVLHHVQIGTIDNRNEAVLVPLKF